MGINTRPLYLDGLDSARLQEISYCLCTNQILLLVIKNLK